MSKRRTHIIEELDPHNVENFSEAQKQFYASMGYKPYLNADGKTVWLSPELHPLRINSKVRRPLFKKLFGRNKIVIPERRRRRPWITKFIRHNWLLFLIIAGLMLFVMFYMHYYM